MLESDYMPPIHKNQHYELFVMRQGFRGDGITLLRSKTIFIPNALPSDRVEIKIVKVLKSFCYGKLTRLLTPSQQRRTAPCPIAAQCGGCGLQHQKYQDQLQFKQSMLNEYLADASEVLVDNNDGHSQDRQPEQPHDELPQAEVRQTKQRHEELRQTEQRHAEQRQTKLRHAELRQTVLRHAGLDPASNRDNNTKPKSTIIRPILSSPSEFHFRNKLQVAIQRQVRKGGDEIPDQVRDDGVQRDDSVARNNNGQVVLGLYAARSHRVVPMPNCLIQGAGINRLLKAITQFLNQHNVTIYNEDTGEGELRHLLLRESHSTGDIMVAIVSAKADWDLAETFATFCLNLNGVESVFLNHNPEDTDEVLGEHSRLLAGRPYIVDRILGKSIKVSLKSFMQANALMVETFYQTIIEQAGLNGSQTVVDAYCGSGALTLAIADRACKVIGVEENPDAIADANQNKALNRQENIQFECARVEDWLPKADVSIDTLIIDPPRQGCKKEVLDAIIYKKIPKVVYGSCNPKSFARDAKLLVEAGYSCPVIQPLDMFPQSTHIELVATFIYVA